MEVNVAQGKTATASRVEGNLDVRKAANAVDGNWNTIWGSGAGSSLNEWLKVDLGAVYDIGKIAAIFEKGAGWQFKLEVSSDDIVWTKVYDGTGTDTRPEIQRIQTFEAGTAVGRYVRISITRITPDVPDISAGLAELEVYGKLVNIEPEEPKEPAKGTNLALRRPSSASNVEGGNHPQRIPANANDGIREPGNPVYIWGSGAGRSLNEWWQVDLGAVYELDQVIVCFEKDNSRGWTYDIAVSNDGVTWTRIYRSTDATSYLPSIRPTSFDAGVAVGRYLRVYVTGLSPDFMSMSAGLCEVEAYGHLYHGPSVVTGKPVSVTGEADVLTLTDGDLETGWTAASNGDKELVVDLRRGADLTGVTLVTDTAVAQQFKVETWDGTAWVLAADKSGNTDVHTRHYVSFASFAQKVRVTLMANGVAPVSLNELLIHGAERIDKAALRAAIDHARTIDLTPYTSVTANALRAAITGAIEALNLATSQDALDAAEAALKAAEAALDPTYKPVEKLTLSVPANLRIARGTTYDFTITWSPATNLPKLSVTSSNASVLTTSIKDSVQGSAKVRLTALRTGSVIVTVKANDGSGAVAAVLVTVA